ncbi:hypothetical protein BPAE_0045g00120 [Botrytis paeoniae]|uniref:Uncharacterized protein n=1 Tax=Botrytis paeoniae TaxID=278948 RepID=A0A4Z1FRS8_9HELO|nr:hypothetical protein BPAE_0045g00120 [Botrytis paeoniae]
MDGKNCEMAKDSLSRSPSLDSGSRIKEDSTSRTETEEGFNILGPKTEGTETDGSSPYQDHSFDHVLDGLPWTNTMPPPSKLCAICHNMVDELRRGDWFEQSKKPKFGVDIGICHVRNPLSLKKSAQNGCSVCATFNCTDDEEKRDAEISAYINKWRVEFEVPLEPSRVWLEAHSGRENSWQVTLVFQMDFQWHNQGPEITFGAFLRPLEIFTVVGLDLSTLKSSDVA